MLSGLMMLCSFFWIGQEISRPAALDFDPDEVYPISARCEERLSGNNHILSAYGHRFLLSRYRYGKACSKGDSLHFHARIQPVARKGNPGEFDYSAYLVRKGVRYSLLPCTDICTQGASSDLMTLFARLQADLLAKTGRMTGDTLCRQLVNALCLGYKQNTEEDFENLFVLTGTMHLLSVSGLHTGAIFMLIQFLLKRAGLPRRSTWIFSIPLIWAYAALTGLSPSVLRAASILSFITAGQLLSRTYTPLNALAASAFLALTLNPDALYSLSFLLSYSAYGGIILVYPLFKEYIRNSSRMTRPLLSSCAISVSAQLPTLPVCAFFFHTMNISGLAANIVAIPLATLILYSATICILLPEAIGSFLFIIPELLSRIFLKLLEMMVPYSINIDGLYPEGLTVILVYLALFLAGNFLFTRRTCILYASAGVLCLLLVQLSLLNRRLASREELVILQRSRNSSVLLNCRGYCYPLYTTLPISPGLPYLVKNKLKAEPVTPGLSGKDMMWNDGMLRWKTGVLAIVHPDTPPYPEADILLVTRNVRPSRLYPATDGTGLPRLVIADGSNRYYRSVEWQAFCGSHGIPFRNTAETGSVVLPLK